MRTMLKSLLKRERRRSATRTTKTLSLGSAEILSKKRATLNKTENKSWHKGWPFGIDCKPLLARRGELRPWGTNFLPCPSGAIVKELPSSARKVFEGMRATHFIFVSSISVPFCESCEQARKCLIFQKTLFACSILRKGVNSCYLLISALYN